MGHYTELQCKIKLRKDTPDNVVSILKRVLIERDLGHDKVLFDTKDVFKPELDHDFFKCERWYMLFLSTNWGDIQGGKMYQEKEYWVVYLHTEFKNYDSEIDKFIDWITPFIVGRKKKQYVGWWQSENMDNRINIYIKREAEKLLKVEPKSSI
jgi:hypothetical protein